MKDGFVCSVVAAMDVDKVRSREGRTLRDPFVI